MQKKIEIHEGICKIRYFQLINFHSNWQKQRMER